MNPMSDVHPLELWKDFTTPAEWTLYDRAIRWIMDRFPCFQSYKKLEFSIDTRDDYVKEDLLGCAWEHVKDISIAANWRKRRMDDGVGSPLEVVMIIFHEVAHQIQSEVFPRKNFQNEEWENATEVGANEFAFRMLGRFLLEEYDHVRRLLPQIPEVLEVCP